MRLKEWAAFLTVSTIWGASYLFIKIGGQELSPFTLVSWRLGLATCGLWVITLLARVRPPTDLPTLGRLFLLGLGNMVVPFSLITWGETTIDSGMASVLNATTPLFSLIIAHFALAEERITWWRVAGLTTGFAGVLLIFGESLAGSALTQLNWPVFRGQLAIVLASLSYASSAVFVRKQLRHVQPLILAVIPISLAFVTTALLALVFESPVSQSLNASSRTVFALACLGLLGTCLAHILYFYVMQSAGATRATLVTYLIPALGVALGALILDERIDWRLLIGFVLIVSGIALVNRKTQVSGKT